MMKKKNSKTKTKASDAAMKLSVLQEMIKKDSNHMNHDTDVVGTDALVVLPESYKTSIMNHDGMNSRNGSVRDCGDSVAMRSVVSESQFDSEYLFDNGEYGGDGVGSGGGTAVGESAFLTDSKIANTKYGIFIRYLYEYIYTIKFLINLFVIGSIIGISYGVYTAMITLEQTNFQQQFHTMSYSITDHIVNQFIISLESLYDLSYQYEILLSSSTSSATNDTTNNTNNVFFPYVTLNTFGQITVTTLQRTKGTMISQHPIVSTNQRVSYEDYISTIQNQLWINESLAYQRRYNPNILHGSADNDLYYPMIRNDIWNFTNEENVIQDGPYYPMWQSSPIVPMDIPLYNQDDFIMLNEWYDSSDTTTAQQQVIPQAVVTKIANMDSNNIYSQWIHNYPHPITQNYDVEPFSFIYYPLMMPISNTNTSRMEEVGILSVAFYWIGYLQNIIYHDPNDYNLNDNQTNDIIIILNNDCNQIESYRLDGPNVTYLGEGDLHDTSYNQYGISIPVMQYANERILSTDNLRRQGAFYDNGMNIKADENNSFIPPILYKNENCSMYTLSIYPSTELYNSYMTSKPMNMAIATAMVILLVSILYLWYIHRLEKQQIVLAQQAKKSSAIVSSLFPAVVRDRLLGTPTTMNKGGNISSSSPDTAALLMDTSRHGNQTTKTRLMTFLQTGTTPLNDMSEAGGSSDQLSKSLRRSKKPTNNNMTNQQHNVFDNNVLSLDHSKPIADLFLETTVMFADISGFTAWCSVREPPQVFILLESVYGAFDKLAKRRNVFKVETIGDCYVAVTGLPEPRKDHAVAMAKFARDCRIAMDEVCCRLEKTLGPDTGELQLRFGLHSGPVTAGVLRGAKGRFQLFGDTVNTASRIESSGTKSKIHVSQATATYLEAAGKKHWMTQREELLDVKGKGLMQTYWVEPTAHARSRRQALPNSVEAIGTDKNQPVDKNHRLVDWVAEVMERLIKNIIARRNATKSKFRNIGLITDAAFFTLASSDGETVLDEVREIVELPEFDPIAFSKQEDPEMIELSDEVKKQLKQYVLSIAFLYNKNPFHNFEHAAHVTMSVTKLMSRIVAPDQVIDGEDYMRKAINATDVMNQNNLASTLHDHTYGITSDPLTQFACVFSSLIHDVDHPGVPNSQLAIEDKVLAQVYKGKSIAEQNSIDLAWDLFMSRDLADLRLAICGTEPEMRHFRQLVINSVMATDIMDPDLKKLRNNRWDVAFKIGSNTDTPRDKINRKATIVIEHIIQASDVAHTMQHWHIYRKWNERLFEEMYRAFYDGRSEKDPSEFWYKGEIGFFDFYIIPLAKKLSECGIFGISSDEYLNYAMRNREEWERRGEEVTAQMMERIKAKIDAARPVNTIDETLAMKKSNHSTAKQPLSRDSSSSLSSDDSTSSEADDDDDALRD